MLNGLLNRGRGSKGLIVLVSPNFSDRKGNANKVSKYRLRKYLFGNKTREKPANFATRGLDYY